MSGTLYLCATPIGNLKDITLRALDILGRVQLIAAEDTRHTQKLLNYYQIKTALTSYHQHNEKGKSTELIDYLKSGRDLALVSDAGLPGISDPGEVLVRRALQEEIPVEVIPGASAFPSGLVISGMPCTPIYFAGFLPSTGKARRDALKELKGIRATQIFYEGPHRLTKLLADILDIYGDVAVVVARELTKLHQELLRGKASEILNRLLEAPPKGEIVVYVAPPAEVKLKVPEDWAVEVGKLVREGFNKKDAIKLLAEKYRVPKRQIYNSTIRPESEESDLI